MMISVVNHLKGGESKTILFAAVNAHLGMLHSRVALLDAIHFENCGRATDGQPYTASKLHLV